MSEERGVDARHNKIRQTKEGINGKILVCVCVSEGGPSKFWGGRRSLNFALAGERFCRDFDIMSSPHTTSQLLLRIF